MFDETFKQQVIDKLVSLVKTPNFDKTYNVVPGDRELTIYLNGKEKFRIFLSYGSCYCYHIVTSEYSININEYDGDHYDQANKSYVKARDLCGILWGIVKRNEEKQKKDEALQKEHELQDRLLKEKEKQNNILSSLDNLINISMVNNSH